MERFIYGKEDKGKWKLNYFQKHLITLADSYDTSDIHILPEELVSCLF